MPDLTAAPIAAIPPVPGEPPLPGSRRKQAYRGGGAQKGKPANPQRAMTKKALSDFIDSPHAPLKVMRRQIAFYEREADKLLHAIQRRQGKRKSVFECEDRPLLHGLLDANNRVLASAIAAAPFVHPRISQIELTGKEGGPVEVRGETDLINAARRIVLLMTQTANSNAVELQPKPAKQGNAA